MANITAQILKGTRDFLPEKMLLRQQVIDTVRRVFESFGFEPLETPAMEYAETLEGKYGEEGDRLIYKFEDRGGRKVALRYDLTVPLSRVVAMYPNLPKPFRRYQISPVWRADKPQKGRYREFWQCDVDIVDAKTMLADAEIMAVVWSVLRELRFEKFTIRVNNRKLLNGLALYCGAEAELAEGLFRSIDKLEKIGFDGVKEELSRKGFGDDSIARMFDLLEVEGDNLTVLGELKQKLAEVPDAVEGIQELEEMFGYAASLGVSDEHCKMDLSLARGLDYYTGPIFETVVAEPKIGSITGGGRYDNLIGMFSGRDIPATGSTVGLERIVDVLEELQLLPASTAAAQVLVTVFDESTKAESIRLAAELRRAGLRTELSLADGKLRGQLSYASAKGVPLVLIAGPDELARGEITLKDMAAKTQKAVRREELVAEIKRALA